MTDKVQNLIGSSKILYQVIFQADKKFPAMADTNVGMNLENPSANLDHQELVNFVLSHQEHKKLKELLGKQVQSLQEQFKALKLSEEDIKAILFGKPAQQSDMLNRKGSKLEAAGKEKLLAGEKDAAKELFKQAKYYFKLAIAIDPRNGSAHRRMAEFRFGERRDDEAFDHLRLAARLDTGSHHFIQMAGQLIQHRNWSAEKAYAWVASELLKNGRNAEALEYYREASRELEKPNPRLAKSLSEKAFFLDEKIYKYEMSISGKHARFNDLLIELRSRGIPLAYVAKDRKVSDETLFEGVRSHGEDPRFQEALIATGFLPKDWIRGGKIKPEILKELMEKGFGKSLAARHFENAKQASDPVQKEFHLGTAHHLDPDNPAYSRALGGHYFAQKDLARAEEYFQRVLKSNRKDPEAKLGMGRIYFAQGNLDRAWYMFEDEAVSKLAPDEALKFFRAKFDNEIGQYQALMLANGPDTGGIHYQFALEIMIKMEALPVSDPSVRLQDIERLEALNIQAQGDELHYYKERLGDPWTKYLHLGDELQKFAENLPVDQKLSRLQKALDVEAKLAKKDPNGSLRRQGAILESYVKLLDETPDDRLNSQSKVEHYARVLHQWNAIRDQQDLAVKNESTHYQPEEPYFRIEAQALKDKMWHAANRLSEIKRQREREGVPGEEGDLFLYENFNNLIERRDPFILQHLSADSLNRYTSDRYQLGKGLDKIWEEIKNPVDQRAPLMALFPQAVALEDSKAWHIVDYVEGTFTAETTDADKIMVYTMLLQDLTQSGLPKDSDMLRRLESKIKDQANDIASSKVMLSEEKPSEIKTLLACREYYALTGDTFNEGMASGHLVNIRTALQGKLLQSKGLLQGFEKIELDAASKLQIAGQIVEINQGLLQQEGEAAQKDDKTREEFSLMQLHALENWRMELANAKDLPLENRLQEAKKLAAATAMYRSMTEGEKPLINKDSFAEHRKALETVLDPIFQEVFLSPGVTSGLTGTPADYAKTLLDASREDFKNRVKLAMDSGDFFWLSKINLDSVAEFASVSQAAHALLVDAKENPGTDSIQQRISAAQVFASLGLMERMEESLKPVADSIRAKPDERDKIGGLFFLAQQYQAAGLKSKANEIFAEIQGFAKESKKKEIRDIGKLAEGMGFMNDGKLAEARLAFLAIPDNAVAAGYLAQLGAKQMQQRGLKAADLVQAVAMNGKKIENKEKVVAELDEIRRLLRSGQVKTFQDGLDRIKGDARFSGAAADLISGYFYGMPMAGALGQNSLRYMVNDASDPMVSDKAFAEQSLHVARKAINQTGDSNDDFGAAGAVSSLMMDDIYVGADAKSFHGGLKGEARSLAIWRTVKNASIIFAESETEAFKSAALWLIPFGVGRWVGAAAEVAWAGYAARSLVTVSPWVVRTAGFGIKVIPETAAIVLSTSALQTAFTGEWDHWKNLHKDFGAMLVTMVLLHGVGLGTNWAGKKLEQVSWLGVSEQMAMKLNQAGKVALRPGVRQAYGFLGYSAKISSLMGVSYLNEVMGLHHAQDLGVGGRFVDAMILDGHMLIGKKAIDGLTGHRITRLEKGTQLKYQEQRIGWAKAQLQPHVEKLGFQPHTTEGQLILNALVGRYLSGEKIRHTIGFIGEKEIQNLKRGLERQLKIHPDTAEGRQLLALLFVYSTAAAKGREGKLLTAEELLASAEKLNGEVSKVLKASGIPEGSSFESLRKGLLGMALSRGLKPEALTEYAKQAPLLKEGLNATLKGVLGEKADPAHFQGLKAELLKQILFASMLSGEPPQEVSKRFILTPDQAKTAREAMNKVVADVLGTKEAQGSEGNALKSAFLLLALAEGGRMSHLPHYLGEVGKVSTQAGEALRGERGRLLWDAVDSGRGETARFQSHFFLMALYGAKNPAELPGRIEETLQKFPEIEASLRSAVESITEKPGSGLRGHEEKVLAGRILDEALRRSSSMDELPKLIGEAADSIRSGKEHGSDRLASKEEIDQALEVLGLSREDLQKNPELLKKQYRALSRQYHPDVHPQGKEMQSKINLAYKLLNSELGSGQKPAIRPEEARKPGEQAGTRTKPASLPPQPKVGAKQPHHLPASVTLAEMPQEAKAEIQGVITALNLPSSGKATEAITRLLVEKATVSRDPVTVDLDYLEGVRQDATALSKIAGILNRANGDEGSKAETDLLTWAIRGERNSKELQAYLDQVQQGSLLFSVKDGVAITMKVPIDEQAKHRAEVAERLKPQGKPGAKGKDQADSDSTVAAAAKGKNQAARIHDGDTANKTPVDNAPTPTPPDIALAGRMIPISRRFSMKESDPGNWSQDRKELEFFSKSEEAGPLAAKAHKLRELLDLATRVGARIEEIQQSLIKASPGSKQERVLSRELVANQKWLEGHVNALPEAMLAYDNSLAFAKAARDRVLTGFVQLEGEVVRPLESNISPDGGGNYGPHAMAPIREKVLKTVIDHPDGSKQFGQLEKAPFVDAGGVTLVVKNIQDVPTVLNAVLDTVKGDANQSRTRAIESASWGGVKAIIAERKAEAQRNNTTLTFDETALESRYESARTQVLAKLGPDPSTLQIEAAVQEIIQKSLDGSGIAVDPALAAEHATHGHAARLDSTQGKLIPDAKGNASVVLTVPGPEGSVLNLTVKIRVASATELKNEVTKKPESIQVKQEANLGPTLNWQYQEATGEWLGTIAGIEGIIFQVHQGELTARATSSPRTVLLNGKEKLELNDQFTPVAENEKDTITIQGRTFQISGHESRLIEIDTPAPDKPPAPKPDAKIPEKVPFALEPTQELPPGAPAKPVETFELFGKKIEAGQGGLVKDENIFENRAESVEALKFDHHGRVHIEAAGVGLDLQMGLSGQLGLSYENAPKGVFISTHQGDKGWVPLAPGRARDSVTRIRITDAQGVVHEFKALAPQEIGEHTALAMQMAAKKLMSRVHALGGRSDIPGFKELQKHADDLFEDAINLHASYEGISHQALQAPRKPGEIARDIKQLASEYEAIVVQQFQKRIDSSKNNLKELIQLNPDPNLIQDYDALLADLAKTTITSENVEAFGNRYLKIYRQALTNLAGAEWKKSGETRKLPRQVSFEIDRILRNQWHLGLFAAGPDPKLAAEFVAELVAFRKDFRPPSGFLELEPPIMTSHYLLGEKPTVNSYLETITSNLRGYRKVFGDQAGVIFHREGRMVQELMSPDPAHPGKKKATGLYLVVQRGQHEYQNGLEIAIYDGPPQTGIQLTAKGFEAVKSPLYKIGVHFGKDNSLQIVNIQGATADYRKSESYQPAVERVKQLTGGANPLDMMIGTVILWGQAKGFSKIEGISDSAQKARVDAVDTMRGGKGHYDLFFKRMGFEKPAGDGDYWSLDLSTMNIRRKKAPPAPPPDQAKDPRYQARTGENSPGQYFRQILIRDSEGRPDKWDKQLPRPLAEPVVAFWKVMVPAFSGAKLQAFEPPKGKTIDTSQQPLKITVTPLSEKDMLEVQPLPEMKLPLSGPPGQSEYVLSFEELLQYAASPDLIQVKEQRDLFLRQRFEESVFLLEAAHDAGLPAAREADLFFALERQLLNDVRKMENQDFIGSRELFLGQRVKAAKELAESFGLGDKPEFLKALAYFVTENIRGVENGYAVPIQDKDLLPFLEASTVPENIYQAKSDANIPPVTPDQILEVAYNLDDPKLYKELEAGEVPDLPSDAYRMEPPPAPGKSLKELAQAYGVPGDPAYYGTLDQAAAGTRFSYANVEAGMAKLKIALDTISPFTRDMVQRNIFLMLAQGKILPEGAEKLAARILSGEARFVLDQDGLRYEIIKTPAGRRDAFLNAQLNLIFRQSGTTLFNAGSDAHDRIFQALQDGRIKIQDVQMIAGLSLNNESVSKLEKLWGPRDQWLMNAGKVMASRDQLAAKRYLRQARATQEIVYLASTKTPFAPIAETAFQALKGVPLGGPEYQKIIATYEKERDRYASSLVANFTAPMKEVAGLLKGDLAGAEVIRVESRPKEPSAVGDKLMRRGHQTLESITDLAGTRVVVERPEDAMRAIVAIREKYSVRETYNGEGEILLKVSHKEKGVNGEEILVLDSVADLDPVARLLEGGASGYRAIHLTVEVDGKPVEIQIQTRAMAEWSDHQHAAAYKNAALDPVLKAEVDRYFKGSADYLSAKERGIQAPAKPELPDLKTLPASTAKAMRNMDQFLDTFEPKVAVAAAAKGKSQGTRLEAGDPKPAQSMGEGLLNLFGKAADLLSRIRIRVGLGSILPGEIYLAPKQEEGPQMTRVGDILGLDGRLALENSVPAGKSLLKLNVTGNFDSVLSQIQNARTPGGDKPEYLILNVEGDNGHRFIVVDTFENLSQSGQLLSLYTGTTPSNKFYLGFRVEPGRDGRAATIHLDHISHSFGSQGEEQAYNAVDGFFRRMAMLYPGAKIVAHPSDRFVVNHLGEGLEGLSFPEGEKLLAALRDWDVLGPLGYDRVQKLYAQKEPTFKKVLAQYLDAALKREREEGRELKTNNALQYLWKLLSDAKRDFASSPNPALRAHADLFDQVFPPDLFLSGRLEPVHVSDVTFLITRASIRSKVAVNDVHTITHVRRGRDYVAQFGDLEGFRAEPDTLADAQKVLEAIHDEVPNSRIAPLALSQDGLSAQSILRYEKDGESFEYPIYFQFPKAQQSIAAPTDPWADKPYLDFQISQPKPPPDPVLERRIRYAHGLVSWFLHENRPEMAQLAMDYVRAVETAVQKDEAIPPPPFGDGYSYLSYTLDAHGKRTGKGGMLIFDAGQTQPPDSTAWTLTALQGSELSLVNGKGDKLRVVLDTKAGGQLLGHLEAGDVLYYQETIKVARGKAERVPAPTESGTAAAAKGKIAPPVDRVAGEVPLTADGVPVFNDADLHPRRKQEVQSWLQGRELTQLTTAEKDLLIKHLLGEKKWKKQDLQNLISPEGMKYFLGYGKELPFGFESQAQWINFQKKLMQELLAAGVPIHDSRVKIVLGGSSVRGRSHSINERKAMQNYPYKWQAVPGSPNKALRVASDLDISIIVDGQLYQDFLDRRDKARAQEGKPVGDEDKDLRRIKKEGRYIYTQFDPTLTKARTEVQSTMKRGIHMAMVPPDSSYVPKPEESMVISPDILREVPKPFPEILDRVGNPKALKKNEGAELLKAIGAAKQAPEAKVEAIVMLASRKDFTDFPSAIGAVMNSGADLLQMENALSRITSLPAYARKAENKAGSGSATKMAGGAAMALNPVAIQWAGELLHQAGPAGLIFAGAAVLAGGAYFLRRLFFGKPEKEASVPPLDPNVRGVMLMDAQDFGAQLTLVGQIPGLTPDMEQRFLAGQWVHDLKNGHYTWIYYDKGGMSRYPAGISDEATYRISAEWRSRMGFPEPPRLTAPNEAGGQKYIEEVEQSREAAKISNRRLRDFGAARGLAIQGSLPGPQADYVLSVLEILPPGLLNNPRYLRGLTLGEDADWSTGGGHYRDGIAAVYHGSVMGPRRNLMGMVLHEIGHSTAARYAIDAKENQSVAAPGKTPPPPDETIPQYVRDAIHADVQSITGGAVNQAFALNWGGGEESRKVYTSKDFSEFISEFHVHYVVAGNELRAHIDGLLANPNTRAQGEAYERVYQEMRGRVFGGAEYASGKILEAPASRGVAAPMGQITPAESFVAPVAGDGEYVLGGGRKGIEGENYIAIPGQVVAQQHAKIIKEGDVLTLQSYSNDDGKSVWVQEGKNWIKLPPRTEYPLERGQRFALGELTYDKGGRAGFERAVVLTIGQNGKIYSDSDLVQRPEKANSFQSDLAADGDVRALQIGPDGRPVATETIRFDQALLPGVYRLTKSENPVIPFRPLLDLDNGLTRIQILSGDPEKAGTDPQYLNAPQLVLKDFANHGAPKNWGTLEIAANGEGIVYLDGKLKGAITVTRQIPDERRPGQNKQVTETFKAGAAFSVASGDLIQIGLTDYTIDFAAGTLKPYAEKHAGLIKAELRVPEAEAAAAAARDERMGRVRETEPEAISPKSGQKSMQSPVPMRVKDRPTSKEPPGVSNFAGQQPAPALVWSKLASDSMPKDPALHGAVAEIQKAREELEETVRRMLQAQGGVIQGTAKIYSQEEIQEILYRVLDRGLPFEFIPGSLREAVDDYMAVTLKQSKELHISDWESAELLGHRNTFTGETFMKKGPDFRAQYRYARMLFNHKLGLPLFGEPTPKEKALIENFAARALKVKSVDSYEKAQEAIIGHMTRFSPEMEYAVKVADPNLRALVIDTFFGEVPYRVFTDPRAAFDLVRSLGKIGFYRELAFGHNPNSKPPRFYVSMGSHNMSHYVNDPHVIILHTHPEIYVNMRGRKMAFQDTLYPRRDAVAKSSSLALFSDIDVMTNVDEANRLHLSGHPTSLAYDAKNRVLQNWVQHPYGLSEISVHLKDDGNVEKVEIRYGLYKIPGLDDSHREEAQKLLKIIQKKYPSASVKIKEVKPEKIEKELPIFN